MLATAEYMVLRVVECRVRRHLEGHLEGVFGMRFFSISVCKQYSMV